MYRPVGEIVAGVRMAAAEALLTPREAMRTVLVTAVAGPVGAGLQAAPTESVAVAVPAAGLPGNELLAAGSMVAVYPAAGWAVAALVVVQALDVSVGCVPRHHVALLEGAAGAVQRDFLD